MISEIKKYLLQDNYDGHSVGIGPDVVVKALTNGRRFEHPYCKECIMPNDIAAETELLDPWADEILERME